MQRSIKLTDDIVPPPPPHEPDSVVDFLIDWTKAVIEDKGKDDYG